MFNLIKTFIAGALLSLASILNGNAGIPSPTPAVTPTIITSPTPIARPVVSQATLQTPKPSLGPVLDLDPNKLSLFIQEARANGVIQQEINRYIGKKVREKLKQDGFTEAYKDLSDEALGNLYIKKYITGESSGSNHPSYFSPRINCTSNTIAGYTYTNCF